MSDTLFVQEATDRILEILDREGLSNRALTIRSYPDETVFVIEVPPQDVNRAIQLTRQFDALLRRHGIDGFTIIRPQTSKRGAPGTKETRLGVRDARALELANVLEARSRTSDAQPSLHYIPDAANSLSGAVEARNHLVFGRRGAGKTALLVEAKRSITSEGHLSAWGNIQTYRHEGAHRTFLYLARIVLDELLPQLGEAPALQLSISRLQDSIDDLLAPEETNRTACQQLVPRLQQAIGRVLRHLSSRLYIFVDDFHYLKRSEQPVLLDLMHGIIRDSDAWLKIACIRHLSRWWQMTPPMGLQIGHDTAQINLDLTLESPTEAKAFLDSVLRNYAEHVQLRSARPIFSDEALSRLVLASGAVPRDYLILAAAAIREARKRPRALQAGVQDVNRAAGEQSKAKLAELEDDVASSSEMGAAAIMGALNYLRNFCLSEKKYTYFRVEFRDKESRGEQYTLIQSLLDVRILHLVSSSLSDKHSAGQRSEVFMLDLSEFSGQRLKKYLHVLDFHGGIIVLKETSANTAPKLGKTPKALQDILRKGPVLKLSELGGAPPIDAFAPDL